MHTMFCILSIFPPTSHYKTHTCTHSSDEIAKLVANLTYWKQV